MREQVRAAGDRVLGWRVPTLLLVITGGLHFQYSLLLLVEYAFGRPWFFSSCQAVNDCIWTFIGQVGLYIAWLAVALWVLWLALLGALRGSIGRAVVGVLMGLHLYALTGLYLDRAGALIATGEMLAIQAREHSPGYDAAYRVTARGDTLFVRGVVSLGIAAAARTQIEATPGLTQMHLEVPEGGWVRESRLLAELVREYGLTTRVTDWCVSACIEVFLAGERRVAASGALFGLHRSARMSNSWLQRVTQGPDTTDDDFDELIEAGASESLIKRVAATPHDDMLYLTGLAMAEEGLATDLVYGRQQPWWPAPPAVPETDLPAEDPRRAEARALLEAHLGIDRLAGRHPDLHADLLAAVDRPLSTSPYHTARDAAGIAVGALLHHLRRPGSEALTRRWRAHLASLETADVTPSKNVCRRLSRHLVPARDWRHLFAEDPGTGATLHALVGALADTAGASGFSAETHAWVSARVGSTDAIVPPDQPTVVVYGALLIGGDPGRDLRKVAACLRQRAAGG